jgi:hypothetical protein
VGWREGRRRGKGGWKRRRGILLADMRIEVLLECTFLDRLKKGTYVVT